MSIIKSDPKTILPGTLLLDPVLIVIPDTSEGEKSENFEQRP
jgi:hypothetical protein